MEENLEQDRPLRLLLVEDHPSQLQTLTDIMEADGFEVIACPTGRSALEHLRREEIGVAVVDLRMPDLGATELLDRLRERDRYGQSAAGCADQWPSRPRVDLWWRLGGHIRIGGRRRDDRLGG